MPKTHLVKRILLVEDDDKDAELIMTALKDNHLFNEIDRVADGDAAINYLATTNDGSDSKLPAVILLDLKLPKISGIDVLRHIREDKALSYLPIVILTSSKEEQDLADCYAMNVNAYVVKPLDIKQFLDAVKQLGIVWAVLNEPLPPGRT